MKTKLIFTLAMMIALSSSAQFYGGVGLGYGAAANTDVIGSKIDNIGTETNIYGSFGQGANASLNAGFMFNDYLGFELGANYLSGSKLTLADVEVTGLTQLSEASSKMLRLTPQLKVASESVYAKFGVIVPVMGKTTVETTKTSGGVETNITVEAVGSFSIGFISAVGYQYSLSESLGLFAELQYVGLSIKGNSSEVTKYEAGGTDMLPNLNTQTIKTEYVDELKVTDNQDTNMPTKELRGSSQYSSFGLNFGLVFYIN